VSSLNELFRRLQKSPGAVLVRVESTQGSAPRESGAWMAVFADSVLDTIGGGHLEWQAIDVARQLLAGAAVEPLQRFALGPSLGQCCGGVVWLRFRRVSASDEAELSQLLRVTQAPVALFGGGHVGRALMRVLSTLPLDLWWIDSRDEIFPDDVHAAVRCEHSDPVHRMVDDLPSGCRVLIMSFSHAEDLDIVATCLKRQRERADLPYIGLIGSQTKWATFRHRLLERGFSESELSQVTCPIGVPGIRGKEPEVIAVAVAAQLLQGLG